MNNELTNNELTNNEYKLIEDDIIYFEETKTNYKESFCIISFVSPETAIRKKLINDISKFIYYSLNNKINEISTSIIKELNIFITNKINDNVIFKDLNEDLKKDLLFDVENITKKNYNKYQFSATEIGNIISTINFDPIESDTVYAINVHGVFSTIGEANKYAQDIKKNVNPNVTCYVGNVGYWCPFNPHVTSNILHKTYDAETNTNSDTGNVQFNTIMDNYNDNACQKDNYLLQQKQYELDSENREKQLLKKKEQEKLAETIKRLKEARRKK